MSAVTASYLQPVLPWSGPQPEDLRFHRILATVLTLFVVAGAVVPYLPIPVDEPEFPPELPARLAYLAGEPVESAPPAGVQVDSPAAAAAGAPRAAPSDQGTPPAPPEAAPEQQAPAPVAVAPAPAPAREVADTGLLALSDALERLRGTTPKIAAVAPGAERGGAPGPAAAAVTGALTIGVTEGSGGIGNAAPTHGEVLGAGGFAVGGVTPGSSVPAAGGVGAGTAREDRGSGRGRFRSEEEIQEILNRHKRAIYTIYNRELLSDPSLQGKVVVSISIAPSGKVTQCRIVYSELKAAAFEGKLVALIRGIDFGAKAGVPPVTTKVPIEFFPT